MRRSGYPTCVAHSAGRLHESDMARALRRSPDERSEIRGDASNDRQAVTSGRFGPGLIRWLVWSLTTGVQSTCKSPVFRLY